VQLALKVLRVLKVPLAQLVRKDRPAQQVQPDRLVLQVHKARKVRLVRLARHQLLLVQLVLKVLLALQVHKVRKVLLVQQVQRQLLLVQLDHKDQPGLREHKVRKVQLVQPVRLAQLDLPAQSQVQVRRSNSTMAALQMDQQTLHLLNLLAQFTSAVIYKLPTL
jgi:hypothetical protein